MSETSSDPKLKNCESKTETVTSSTYSIIMKELNPNDDIHLMEDDLNAKLVESTEMLEEDDVLEDVMLVTEEEEAHDGEDLEQVQQQERQRHRQQLLHEVNMQLEHSDDDIGEEEEEEGLLEEVMLEEGDEDCPENDEIDDDDDEQHVELILENGEETIVAEQGAQMNLQFRTKSLKKNKTHSLQPIYRNEVGDSHSNNESEQPSVSTRSLQSPKADKIDEKQCRVCTSKDDLLSLFKIINEQSIAEMLMTICPTVNIAIKDFLPQFICNTCLDNVVVAINLKNQCEMTEKEFRKSLSRHKNKIRRPSGYIVIDAPLESDNPTEEEANNDEEFKISDDATATPDEDSDDSDYSSNKWRRSRSTGARRGRRPTNRQGDHRRGAKSINVKPNLENHNNSGEENNFDGQQHHKGKRKRQFSPDGNSTANQFACDECDAIFTRKLSLILHKKSHSASRKPVPCPICGKIFKIRNAYYAHIEKHKNVASEYKCNYCENSYVSSTELKRHITTNHSDLETGIHQCEQCKRIFVSGSRLMRHRNNRCRGYEAKYKKMVFDNDVAGKDLFKSVAPLTTTYWSDSFSD